MVLVGRISDEEHREMEEKCEHLISVALEEGAEANYFVVRRQMNMGREVGLRLIYFMVLAHLEYYIAKARREQRRRASRRPFIIWFKNLFGL